MEIKLFTTIFGDKHFPEYKHMNYKYGVDFNEFLSVLKDFYYKDLPISDFNKNKIVFIENHASINQNTLKMLLKSQDQYYGIKAAEDEIVATSAIESIDFSRDSVRKILKGMAPDNETENRILGIKKGLEFIADTSNKITEENLYKLYMMAIGNFLNEDNKLSGKNLYRHDTVYVVSDHLEHSGLDYKKIPEYMKSLFDFINEDDDINDLIKAAIIHFYIAFVHPYFDGNGRISRLLHLWFLIQKGYQSTLFIPFSSSIEKSRKAYYDAFTLIEENKKFSNIIDITPFIIYFINNVYNKISENYNSIDTFALYDENLKSGKITEKEKELWQFVLSFYGTSEFSTKQLEKDFGNAAYATIRSFVLKFEELDLFSSVKYGVRVKYKVVK